MNNRADRKSIQETVAQRWLESIRASYHPDVAKFLKREKNQFANPVGHTMAVASQGIVGELFGDMDAEKTCGHLAEIIKVRALQDFTPAQAIEFVFSLKDCVRNESGGGKSGVAVPGENLDVLDKRIDQLALYAFDIYVKCREQMYEYRVNEMKRSVASVVRRLNRSGAGADLTSDEEEEGFGCEKQTERC